MITDFINNFAGAESVFMNGCCYWFAKILNERFGGTIMYIPAENHFVNMIDYRVYDIRGDVSSMYAIDELFVWSEYDKFDKLDHERIVRDCVNKIPA